MLADEDGHMPPASTSGRHINGEQTPKNKKARRQAGPEKAAQPTLPSEEEDGAASCGTDVGAGAASTRKDKLHARKLSRLKEAYDRRGVR